jgi:hypothetical protein
VYDQMIVGALRRYRGCSNRLCRVGCLALLFGLMRAKMVGAGAQCFRKGGQHNWELAL